MYFNRRCALDLLLVSTAILLAGMACHARVQHVRPTTGQAAAFTAPPARSPAETARVADNCGPFGAPVRTATWSYGPTTRIYRDEYVLEHSSTDKIPVWVCEHVTRDEVTGDLTRPGSSAFKPDPALSPGARAELSDYKGSGLDRGHMAPSGNQTRNRDRQLETFYLSNMAPQTAALNQRIWKSLEETVRDWAEADGELWTITGPLFYDPAEDNPATADGEISFDVIGENEVAVPTHCYKIVLENRNGTWLAIAFVMRNQEQTFSTPYHFEHFVRSIDWIEAHAHVDFFPQLTAAQEAALERTAADPGDWGLTN